MRPVVGSSVTEMCLPVPEELNDGCIIVTTKLHICVRGLVNRLGGGREEEGGEGIPAVALEYAREYIC